MPARPAPTRARLARAGWEIISGHHRALAAKQAGLTEVPCWVREMGDDEAYMALALCNAQGELHPLEVGRHALDSGKTVRDYVAKTGQPERALYHKTAAAKVVAYVGDEWIGAFQGTPEQQCGGVGGAFRHGTE